MEENVSLTLSLRIFVHSTSLQLGPALVSSNQREHVKLINQLFIYNHSTKYMQIQFRLSPIFIFGGK